MNKLTIALAGNPNSGKTTLFNALTGARQKVGNWPGVTVERKEGRFTHKDYNINVIDLPGIYSFSSYSLDEKISREYILQGQPDLVVNIVDATNLERNLYLTTQILEMKRPLVVALNMTDIAKQRKIRIEIEHLAQHLGCPVIPIVATKRIGIDKLRDTIIEAALSHKISQTRVFYDSVVEDAIEKLKPQIALKAEEHNVDQRWLAIKLLESDELAISLTENAHSELIKEEKRKIEKHTNLDTDIVVADGRYGFIHGLAKDVIHRESELRKTISDAIDTIVLNRFLGIPIFLAIMYLVFTLTVTVGESFIDFFELFFGTIFVDGFAHLLEAIGSPDWLIIFLAEGVGGGIETVSTFIPPIFFIFLCLSILEDSGYMSRAAFVMDRFMRYIGLPGKAFIPMLVGFGCTVPAVMATRTLGNNRDRLLTIMINPLMSCGAKLPVYALFATIFFPQIGGTVIFILYIIGIALAILMGFVFKSTILRGDMSAFVMELPPYHIPTINGIFLHTWTRLKSFVLRAGKVILIAVVVLSFLNSIGTDGEIRFESSEKSILSFTGKTITPIFKPMGIEEDNWPATVGLFTGIFAKEVIIGTLDALYAQVADIDIEDEDDFSFIDGIKEAFVSLPFIAGGEEEEEIIHSENEMANRFGGKNNAFAYLLFVLIYAPCLAAIAAIYRETNLKWTLFSVFYLTILAWIIATIYYQFSIFTISPLSSLGWIIGCVVFSVGSVIILRKSSFKFEIE